MQKVKIEPFKLIGISIQTSNENGQSAQDIADLWGRFRSEGVAEKIPNKMDRTVFSLYTNYQGDHTKPYDTIIGCKVSSLDVIPEGMIGKSFNGGSYGKFISKGNLMEVAIYNTWVEIHQNPIDRSFDADFEIYGEKAMNPMDAEVEIFVGLKEN